MKVINEPERHTAVYNEVDIIVVGGGTAGVAAALAAAREGLRTALVEQFGALGGTATMGLVTPMMFNHIEGFPMDSSISCEINSRLLSTGYGAMDSASHSHFFDPLALQYILEEMVAENDIQLLYHTLTVGVIKEEDAVKGIIFENKSGRHALLGKVIIDCTGDGDVACMAGAAFEKGDPHTGKNQPVSLRYMLDGVDIDKFSQYIKGMDCSFTHTPPFFHTAVVWDKNWPLEKIFKEAVQRGDLHHEDGMYWQVFGIPGRGGTLAFNCPEIFDFDDAVDPGQLTQAQLTGKKAIFRQLRFYKKYLPGFEQACISMIAPMVGIRESRRIIGEHYLSDSDVVGLAKYPDYIARSNYPVDIHGKTLRLEQLRDKVKDETPYYHIPYRCLVPKGISCLLVAGRCISASFLAQSSLRIQPTVRSLGEAAGTAAAYAINHGIKLAKVDGAQVRKIMTAFGAKM